MTGIKAIIFDCDGTLVDSEEAHVAAWRKTLHKRGHDLKQEQIEFFTGKSDSAIAMFFAESIKNSSGEEILREKRSYYRELQELGIPPIESTIEFVHRLAEAKNRLGIKLGVASAALKSEILAHLRHVGIEQLFEVILSGHDDLADYNDSEGVNKPKPYVYLHAAKLLGVPPRQCVVFEDTETGVTAGRAAGCITIAIPNRFTERQNLSAANLRIKTLSGVNIDDFLLRLSCLR